MKLTLIRHSKSQIEPQVPIPQWGLSEEGIELAKELSSKQEIKNLDVIYSSLQTKALETALYLAKPNFIPIKTHPDLTEITSVTNKFLPDFETKIKLLYSGELNQLSDGETLEEARNRSAKAVESIVERERTQGSTRIG